MHEQQLEVTYNQFDLLIDSCVAIGLIKYPEILRKMRDNLPDRIPRNGSLGSIILYCIDCDEEVKDFVTHQHHRLMTRRFEEVY